VEKRSTGLKDKPDAFVQQRLFARPAVAVRGDLDAAQVTHKLLRMAPLKLGRQNGDVALVQKA
jgi:hypothetical protein